MAKCNELYNGLFKKDNRSPPSYPAFSYFCVILILDRSIYQIEMKRKKKILTIIVLAVTILSGIKSIKYVLMHSKTWLTVDQYNLMIDCVLGIILIAEIFMIYASFV